MKNIVYTIRDCPYCSGVVGLLKKLKIEFEERLIEDLEEKQRLKREYRWPTFPMVVMNGKFVGGYDDTQALADLGRLDDILGRKRS